MMYKIYSKIDIIERKPIEVIFRDLKLDTLEPEADIIVASIVGFNSIAIDSDIDNLTDTCRILIPLKNMGVIGGNTLEYCSPSNNQTTEIKVGYKINIELLFYTTEEEGIELKKNWHPKVFVGYIKGFNKLGDNIEIVCEDSMYLFKQIKLKYSLPFTSKYQLFQIGAAEDAIKKAEVKIKGLEAGDSSLAVEKQIIKQLKIVIENKAIKEALDSVVFSNNSLTVLINDIIGRSAIPAGSFLSQYRDNTVLDLGRFRTAEYVTGAEILQKLKDDYGFSTYFKNTVVTSVRNGITTIESVPVLYSGLKYPIAGDTKSKTFNFIYPYDAISSYEGPQLKNNLVTYNFSPIISSNLDYEKFDKSVELITFGSSINKKTNVRTVIATIDGIEIKERVISGNTDNDISDFLSEEVAKRSVRVDINIDNIDITTLKQIVLTNWNNYKDIGFSGSFTTFGEPMVSVGDKVRLLIDNGIGNIKDLVLETYFVDRVITRVTENYGFTQEITIGTKIKSEEV